MTSSTLARKPRYYLDTSVFGGCFDTEFAEPSKRLFESIRMGQVTALMSRLVIDELTGAPQVVRELASQLDATNSEFVVPNPETEALALQYIAAGVITSKWTTDARHVALASWARAEVIVSWNFKHLVNVHRIRGFNAVNIRLGYQPIDIRSPLDLAFLDDSEVLP